jgi:hypothetical protein
MFFHLQYIHLFRPFLKYVPSVSPLPAHVSPRRICTANAGAISKLMRLYKKTWNLRQIPNIAVYIIQCATTIHLLNLPEKTARRDIIHGVKHLEEIAEDWICARRTLSIVSVLARKWKVELPEEAAMVLKRTDEKYGTFSTSDVPSPRSSAHQQSASPPEYPNSPANAKMEQYSPMIPYANSQLTPEMAPGTPDMMLSNPPMVALSSTMGKTPQPQQQQQVPVTQAAINLSPEGVSSSGPWINPSMTPSLPQYHQRYIPTVSQSPMTSSQTSRSGTRQVTPSAVFAGLDNEFFLNDSAKWHQNFVSWDLGQGGMGNSGATGGVSSAAGSSSSAGADPVFTFRNGGGGGLRPTMDENLAGFDTLGGASLNGGWLSGLE